MDKRLMGKKSRAQGKAFELKVRHDLESKGWIICRWSNNVEFGSGSVVIDISKMDSDKGIVGKAICNSGKLISAKHIFNPFTKAMSTGNGFPDFIAYSNIGNDDDLRSVMGVESKMDGVLTKIEKQKCEWLLAHKIFSKITIARKPKTSADLITGDKIIYEDFKEKVS